MNVKALAILIGEQRVGVLFQYALSSASVINRFVADESFISSAQAPLISLGFLAGDPAQQAQRWRDIRSEPFNGRASRQGWLLPAFFQNLLPEGVFRDHVAALRGCDPQDHFEMLAACGRDLPGRIHAVPVALSRDELARYVTQGQDALEMTVTADPLEDGVSLSGVQPKLGVIRDGQRYVGRTKDHDTHIIAKLPVVGQPLLPEVEHLSLQLAAAAGVDVCEARLEPLSRLQVAHHYDLGDDASTAHFLAVTRFDRSPAGRIHVEDFAQVLGDMPEDKYGGPRARSYLDIAAVLMRQPSMGEPAVIELLRRLLVNELIGNPDMHLKNIGLRYPDGLTPHLSPAYDVVAYAVYHRMRGHALHLLPPGLGPRGDAHQQLGPALVRAFCAALRIPEKLVSRELTQCARQAADRWPGMIASSRLTALQQQRLRDHMESHPMIASLRRRQLKRAGEPADTASGPAVQPAR